MSTLELTATTVRLTQQHIDAGRPGDACVCAFALAVIDALDFHDVTAYRVDVGSAGGASSYEGWRAEVNLGDAVNRRLFIAPLPGTVVDWILAFDDGAQVSPFEIQLIWELAA